MAGGIPIGTVTAMSRSVVVTVVLALLAAVPTAAAEAKAPGILYSLDANRGEVVQVGGAYRLALPAATRVTWFTDRPARRSGSMTLRGLASIWLASGFAADPPNAAVILASPGKESTHVVELRRPKVVGTSVSFALRAVPSASVVGFRHADELVPGGYRHTAVFIDDAAAPPCLSSTSATASTTTTCLLSSSPAGQTTIYPPRSTSKSSSTSSTVTTVSACASGAAFSMQVGTGYVGIPACGQGLAAFMMLTVGSTSMPSPQLISNVQMLPNGTTAQSPSAIVLTVSTAVLMAPPAPPANSSSPSAGVTLVGVTSISAS